MLEKKNKGALFLGRFTGGRKYFTNAYGEVCLIECACCKEIKPAGEFHNNNFKKFNKQNYCISCNNERLEKKAIAKKRAKEIQKPEPVFIYLIQFTDNRVYIGRTKNIVKRMEGHINNCKRGIHSSRYIQETFYQKPEEVIRKFTTPKILYVDLKGSREQACKVERAFIDSYVDKGLIVLGGKY